MKSRIAAGIVVVVFLAAAGGGVWYAKKLRTQPAGMEAGFEPAESVQTVVARTAPFRKVAQLSGTVVPLRAVTLATEVSGVVKEIRFDSDQVVEEGQVLIELDSSTEHADLEAVEASIGVAEASVRAAEASVKLWESNLARMEEAMKAKAVAATEMDNARSQLDAGRAQADKAKSEVEQARARAAQVKTQIEKKMIRAPFAARTGLRNIHPGQYLAEGATIVSLQGVTDDIYLDFAIPQEYLSEVKQGDIVIAQSAVLGSEPAKIQIVAIDAEANYQTRNVRVRTKVDNRGGKLRQGMFVDVSVPVGATSNPIVVPATAVRRAAFGDHVFVISPSAGANAKPGELRAQQRFITLGPMIGGDVVVVSGLKDGEEIAAAGSFKLRDGSLVIKGAPDGAAPGGPAHGQAGEQAGSEKSASK
ncbi:MAG: efflux RND transporter periplasmic adaptor subunit [Phycisphaerales bacterium]|nr:efflux RND transporter periplasmic adaptor subunit [Phycisphaerales bacterium]